METLGKTQRKSKGKYGPKPLCLQTRMAKFMEPCLLLLLSSGKSHGYELMDMLGELGFEGSSSDMATLYRTLRQLEENGMVASSWEEGSQGPQKRVYEITSEGLALLDSWAVVVRKNKNRLSKFLGLFESRETLGTPNPEKQG